MSTPAPPRTFDLTCKWWLSSPFCSNLWNRLFQRRGDGDAPTAADSGGITAAGGSLANSCIREMFFWLDDPFRVPSPPEACPELNNKICLRLDVGDACGYDGCCSRGGRGWGAQIQQCGAMFTETCPAGDVSPPLVDGSWVKDVAEISRVAREHPGGFAPMLSSVAADVLQFYDLNTDILAVAQLLPDKKLPLRAHFDHLRDAPLGKRAMDYSQGFYDLIFPDGAGSAHHATAAGVCALGAAIDYFERPDGHDVGALKEYSSAVDQGMRGLVGLDGFYMAYSAAAGAAFLLYKEGVQPTAGGLHLTPIQWMQLRWRDGWMAPYLGLGFWSLRRACPEAAIPSVTGPDFRCEHAEAAWQSVIRYNEMVEIWEDFRSCEYMNEYMYASSIHHVDASAYADYNMSTVINLCSCSCAAYHYDTITNVMGNIVLNAIYPRYMSFSRALVLRSRGLGEHSTGLYYLYNTSRPLFDADWRMLAPDRVVAQVDAERLRKGLQTVSGCCTISSPPLSTVRDSEWVSWAQECCPQAVGLLYDLVSSSSKLLTMTVEDGGAELIREAIYANYKSFRTTFHMMSRQERLLYILILGTVYSSAAGSPFRVLPLAFEQCKPVRFSGE